MSTLDLAGVRERLFRMKRLKVPVLILFALATGFVVGWVVNRDRDVEAIQRIVAMGWGDGRYGEAFYGAEVYLVPAGSGGHAVHARVWIGRGNGYYRDLGSLGKVASAEEAVAKWGDVQWTAEGLTIGPGNGRAFFVPRATIESHR